MDVPSRVDVLVAGAGPAGSAAALNACRLAPGATVLLVDRADFPRDKACGDGVGPEGVDVLERLGVADRVLAGHPPIGRVRIVAPDGTEATGEAPRPGHVVPRQVLDARLRDAAIDRGATPVTARVLDVSPHGTVHLRVRGTEHLVRAGAVVGADGANSTVRRSLGLPEQPRERTGLAMRGYAHAPDDWPDELYIGFVTDRWPAYAWAFPDGRGRVNVGYGPFDSTEVDRRSDLVGGIEAHLPASPSGRRVVVEPASLRAHHLPLSTDRPPPAVGRVLLVGDAASLVHPMTGEGIYYSLLSGAMAGACAVRFADRPGRAYTRALHRRLGRHLRHTTAAARVFRHTYPVDLSVRAAARHPATLDELCEFALGTGLLSPGLVARLTRAGARDLGRRLAGGVRGDRTGQRAVRPGPGLVLEPLAVEHAEQLHVVLDDPSLHEHVGGAPPTLAELQERLAAKARGGGPDEVWCNWVLRRSDDDTVVGYVQATIVGDTADVAWVVGAAHQRRGHAVAGATAMLDLLAERGVTQVSAWIADGNVASTGVARRLGLDRTDELDDDGERRWTAPLRHH